MKIAAILLNYNSADDCRKSVGYLLKQRDVELEIVIVDNASRPDDAEAVRALCAEHSLTFIAADSNRGYNAGNNIGLRYAWERGYRYALIANPDMEFPDPTYLSRLASTLEAHPDAVAAGSDIVTPEGVHQNPKRRDETDWRGSFGWIKQLFSRRAATVDVPDWIENPLQSKYCRCLNGCCLMLRMDYIESIGYFDERTFLYGEEPILGRRIELDGRKMYYFADATAVHDHKKSREGSPAFCNRHWRHSQILYIRHYSCEPFYGRWLAELSCRTYFFALNLNHRLRALRR